MCNSHICKKVIMDNSPLVKKYIVTLTTSKNTLRSTPKEPPKQQTNNKQKPKNQ